MQKKPRQSDQEKTATNRPASYVADYVPLGQNDLVKCELPRHDDHVTMSKCPGDQDMVSNNNKDNNKDDNKSNYLPTYESQAGEERKVVSVLGEEEC